MRLGIGGIRDVMSDYLVDDMFICVFHYDIQRHDVGSWLKERFEFSDVGCVLVLRCAEADKEVEEVSDDGNGDDGSSVE